MPCCPARLLFRDTLISKTCLSVISPEKRGEGDERTGCYFFAQDFLNAVVCFFELNARQMYLPGLFLPHYISVYGKNRTALRKAQPYIKIFIEDKGEKGFNSDTHERNILNEPWGILFCPVGGPEFNNKGKIMSSELSFLFDGLFHT